MLHREQGCRPADRTGAASGRRGSGTDWCAGDWPRRGLCRGLNGSEMRAMAANCPETHTRARSFRPRAAPPFRRVVPPHTVRGPGTSDPKARVVAELARGIEERQTTLETLAEMSDAPCVVRPMRRRGTGHRTAAHAPRRGLGRVHVFARGDAGARRNRQRGRDIGDAMDDEAVRRTLAPWRPCAGLIRFHFLLPRLAESGYPQ